LPQIHLHREAAATFCSICSIRDDSIAELTTPGWASE
jgi:hypothetical protein